MQKRCAECDKKRERCIPSVRLSVSIYHSVIILYVCSRCWNALEYGEFLPRA